MEPNNDVIYLSTQSVIASWSQLGAQTPLAARDAEQNPTKILLLWKQLGVFG